MEEGPPGLCPYSRSIKKPGWIGWDADPRLGFPFTLLGPMDQELRQFKMGKTKEQQGRDKVPGLIPMARGPCSHKFLLLLYWIII